MTNDRSLLHRWTRYRIMLGIALVVGSLAPTDSRLSADQQRPLLDQYDSVSDALRRPRQRQCPTANRDEAAATHPSAHSQPTCVWARPLRPKRSPGLRAAPARHDRLDAHYLTRPRAWIREI